MGVFVRISVLMKKSVLAIILLLSATSFVVAQTNQVDSKGRKQGEWIKYYPKSKHVEYKGSFVDDKPDGVFYYYFYDGSVKMVAKHDSKTLRSEVYTYHENKKVKSFGIYKNQLKDSVWTYYSNTGSVSKRESYKNNLLDGMSITYYVNHVKKGEERVVEAIPYVKGKMEGEAKKYYINGTLQQVSHYVNDRLDGVFETYDPGNVKTSTSFFKNGKRHGIATVYQGSKQIHSYFIDGEKVPEAKFRAYMNKEKKGK